MLKDAVKRLSIEWKLPIAICGLLVVVTMAFSWAAFVEVRVAARRNAAERLQTLISQLGEQLRTSTVSIDSLTQSRAAQPPVIAYLQQATPRTESAARAALIPPAGVRALVAVQLLDSAGRLRLSVGPMANRIGPLALGKARLATRDGRAAGVGDFGPLGDSVIMPAIAPVTPARGAPGYLVEWWVITTSVRQRERTSQLLGPEAAIYLGTATGRWTDMVTLVDAPPVDVTKVTGVVRYDRPGTGWRSAAAARVGVTPWYVVIEMSDHAILAPTRRLLNRLTVIALVLLALGLSAAWVASRRITGPLRQLTAAAEALSQGDFERRVSVGREDEMGRLDRAFNLMASRMQDSHGQLEMRVAERTRELDEALKRLELAQEARFKRVLEHVSEIISVVGPNGTIQYSSPSVTRILGYPPDERLGKSVLEHVHPDDVSRFRELLEVGAAQGGGPRSAECRVRRADGQYRLLEIVASPLSEDPVAHEVVLTSRDITSRRQLEEQYRQSQKMEAIGRLAAGVAHDFNNLLAVVLMSSEYLAGRLAPDDPRGTELAEIRSAASRASELTRQLLAFSRQQVLQPKTIDIDELVANLESMLRRLLGEDIVLRRHRQTERGLARVDVSQIDQVLMNLAVNARDAMPKGGTLTIETGTADLDAPYPTDRATIPAGRYVTLTVTDNGTGMSEETRTHVFEPFFTTKGRDQGTGLGLATVFGIVSQSGGYIWLYSELGRGTTFKIYLPRVDEGAAQPSPVEEVVPSNGGETLLLVEDGDLLRVASARVLTALGYTVLVAENGAQALQIAAAHDAPIDLLVSDVVMPGISGPDLAQHLVAGQATMKVLLVSGYADDVVAKRGGLEGRTAFLQKPYTGSVLARRIREVLDGA